MTQAARHKQDSDLSEYVFGKVQPQATELEMAVLGALMIDREVILSVSDTLRPDSFYKEAHQHIYSAILALFKRSHPVDILTVTEELRKTGQLDASGGSYYLAELTNMVASSANVEYHARIIAQKRLRRIVIESASNAIAKAYDDEIDDFAALEYLEKMLFSIWNSHGSVGAKTLGALSMDAAKTAEKSLTSKGLVGVPSGLTTIDRITGGWQPTDLIILAARPGMGKTALAVNMAYNAAKDFKKPVGVFSLEMSGEQLAARVMSADTKVSTQHVRTGRITEADVAAYFRSADSMKDVPVYVDDSAGLTVFQLRAAARRMKVKHGIELLVVDYLQLMEGTERGQNREQAVTEIARGLKHLAKELKIPVIALSQLSRAVENRGGSKRPQLSDLRESGGIEQEADIVTFLYRPEYYGIIEDEKGASLKGITEIIFAKNRHGKLGTERLAWNDVTTTFTDIDAFPASQFSDNPPPVLSNIPASARPNIEEDVPF